MEEVPKDPQAETIERLTDKVDGLQEALLSRDVIGQAKGILMERFHLTADQAFDQLRDSSQQLNLKLRELAARVAETGQWPIELDGQSLNGKRPH
jgi:AmiR/NasT family two-component response regulator